MKNDNNLDDINNERVETTKLRVAHAIKLLNNPVACLSEGRKLDDAETDIAHAVNLLEAASQDMQWVCDHFEWDNEICIQIDDACLKLGCCLANLLDDKADEYDPAISGYEGKDALAVLGKVIATLIRWNDDTANVSEV